MDWGCRVHSLVGSSVRTPWVRERCGLAVRDPLIVVLASSVILILVPACTTDATLPPTTTTYPARTPTYTPALASSPLPTNTPTHTPTSVPLRPTTAVVSTPTLGREVVRVIRIADGDTVDVEAGARSFFLNEGH